MRRRNCKDRLSVRGGPADPTARPIAGSLPVALLLTSLGVGAFGGCSSPVISFPSAAKDTLVEPTSTGSIARPPTSFGDDLGEEDWRRAHAALAVALDPQGNGRPVRWDNPDSGLRGAVNPTGLPYVADDEICRDFLASVVSPASGGQASRFLRGTGCKPSGGTWALKRLRKAKDAAKDAPREPARGAKAGAETREATRAPGSA